MSYEPKSPPILLVEDNPADLELTLLALGIQNIRLGPTLPAFVSPAVLRVLVDKFGLKPVTTPDADLAEILKK